MKQQLQQNNTEIKEINLKCMKLDANPSCPQTLDNVYTDPEYSHRQTCLSFVKYDKWFYAISNCPIDVFLNDYHRSAKLIHHHHLWLKYSGFKWREYHKKEQQNSYDDKRD